METRSVAWLRRVRDWTRSLDFTLARRFGLANREDRLFFLLIGLVGVIGGLLGLVTEFLIGSLQQLLWGEPGDLLAIAPQIHPRWMVVVPLAVGGALLGLILFLGRRRLKGEASGEGMGTLIEAVALSGGKIAPRPVLINALAAIVTVGSGGSLGREGPMIRLGVILCIIFKFRYIVCFKFVYVCKWGYT